MSVDITEKQHYVWRKYLSAWQDDPTDYRLWTGLIKQNQVKRLGLKDVAQSRFFYKLEELTDAELLFLSQYKSRLSSNIQSIANPIISGYRWFTNIKRTIAKGIITPGEDFLHEIKKMEANVFEDIQSQIEHMGDDLLKCKSSGDLKTLAVEQEYEILFYLMVQYMRTKTRKDSFSNTLLDAPVLKAVADKCWPFFNIVTAMQWVDNQKGLPIRVCTQ